MRNLPVATVGIVGAGQLGLMLCEAARRLGIATLVLASSGDDPAVARADAHIIGDRFDAEALRRLAARSDVVTFEIEHADTRALAGTAAAVYPSPVALETIRDKWLQRSALEAAGIPGPRAALWERALPGDERALPGEERGASAAYQGESASHGPLPRGMTYPVVQKLRRGGYDGRGVAVLRDEHGTRLPGESLVEEFVPVEKEVSVLVARSASGREAVYPPVLMEFDSEANINTLCALPSGLSPRLADTASEVAARAVRSLDIVGICAVELFITDEGRVLVNELAPRPHNSGHLTLEASATSQFEQHLRAILDLPLGSTDTVRPAVMVNLLGSGEVGRPAIEGLDSVLALPEAHLHLYDKRPSKPGRKMGHITVCGETIERARERADVVRRAVAIVGVQTAHE